MIAVLLVWLSQAVPPVDTSGFTSNQKFWYAMASLVVPILVGALAFAGSLLAAWQARQAVKKVDVNTALTAATQAEVAEVHTKVNGHSAELREYAERAGRAEGKAEALEQATAAAPTTPLQVVLDPDAQPGGRRRLDPKLPDSAPPEASPPGGDPVP